MTCFTKLFVTPNSPTHLEPVKGEGCPGLQISRESGTQKPKKKISDRNLRPENGAFPETRIFAVGETNGSKPTLAENFKIFSNIILKIVDF